MHVLRVFLRSGAQIELLYRGKGDLRTSVHTLELATDRVSLVDDFGKSLNARAEAIDAWQPSDYAAELEGALAITRAKQKATEKFQREMQGKHSLLVPQVAGNMRNGGIIAG